MKPQVLPSTSSHFDDEVCAFFDQYAEAFRRLAARDIAAFWTPPTLAIQADGAKTCATDEVLQSVFERVVGEFEAAGLVGVDYEILDQRSYGDNLRDVRTTWTLTDERGSTIKRLDNIYVLRRTAAGLKIAAVYLL
jgi:hypothetical protein